MKIKALTLIAGLAIASHANAAYTFVDATPNTGPSTGNTTLDSATLVDGTNFVNGTGTTSDNLWSYRTVAGYAGGAYFESDGSAVLGDRESTGNLVTTITLGAIGTYDIAVIFDGVVPRDIAAKMGSAPTTANIFTTSTSTLASNLTFAPALGNSRTSTYAGFLPQFTSTSLNQTVSIFVNGLESTAASDDERTQYDGVAFQLVPEPSTALLGAISALALLRRRRN